MCCSEWRFLERHVSGLQLKATAEKLAFLRQVPILEGSNSRQLTQLHFVLEKCAVQRGHVFIMEGQPCAGMCFMVSGKVNILARRQIPTAADASDGSTEVSQDASAEMSASVWNPASTLAWWGLAGADRQAAGAAIHLIHQYSRR